MSKSPIAKECKFVKQDEALRLVYGVVYPPEEVDADEEWASIEEIRKAAHAFLAEVRAIKVQHLIKKDSISIVESYTAPVEFSIDEQVVPKGSWVMVTKVWDDDVWGLVVKGELTGYSMAGFASRVQEDFDARGGR